MYSHQVYNSNSDLAPKIGKYIVYLELCPEVSSFVRIVIVYMYITLYTNIEMYTWKGWG